MTRKTLAALLLLLLLGIQDSAAQTFKRRKARRKDKPPKAILVELHTYPRTANYFIEKGNTSKFNSLQIAVDSVNKRMVMDFDDNFSYCPVYYFVDTNMQKVLARNFEGVLLDASLQPIEKTVLAPTDSNYNIVYFGQPTANYPEISGVNNQNDLYDSDISTQLRARKRLIALNHKGKPIKQTMPSEVNSRSTIMGLKKGRYYYYKSKEHDVYYMPYAKQFSNKLNYYYGPYPYNR